MNNIDNLAKQNFELIKVSQNNTGEIIVNGRELHAFLEVKTNYSTWFERMADYGFIENTDYILLSDFEKRNGSGGQNKIDHAVKLDMAKEISMIQRNEKGKRARQYFIEVEKRYKQQPQFSSLELALKAALDHEQAIKEIKNDVSFLKGSMRIDSLQQQEIQQIANQAVVHALGGKESVAYKEISRKAYSAFWNEFKQHFKVPRYGDIPKVKQEEAIRFIKLWRPSTSLQMEIDSCNNRIIFYEK